MLGRIVFGKSIRIREETLVEDQFGLKHRRKDSSASNTMSPLSPEGLT